MKSSTWVIVLCVLILVGCAQKGPKTGAASGGGEPSLDLGKSGASGVHATPLGQAGSRPIIGSEGSSGIFGSEYGPKAPPGSPLAQRVIYFAYNSDDLGQQYHDVVNAHAGYLTQNPGQHLRLAGHTDERGSREYNLGLGERRSLSVLRLMMLRGVSRSQIEVISYGEEVPDALGHTESDWSQNRRVVLEYVAR